MATKEKDAPTKTNGVARTETAVMDVNTISREEAAKRLNSLKVGELDSGYLTFKAGDKHRVVFLGWKEINGIGEGSEKVNSVKLLTDSGKELINADAVIRSYFERQQIGCARQITCKGENTTRNGTYKTFDFHVLND